jgi:hypothetical protein
MSNFLRTVCLPPTEPSAVPAATARPMTPCDFNLTDDWNPVGEWDWWVVDSRTGSACLALPEHDGDSRLVTASTVPTGTADLAPLGPLECCGGPRGPLDFDAATVTGSRPRAVSTISVAMP